MHRRIIVMAILLSACRLIEEPTQQVKSALGRGDIVFDALDLGKTAVMQCNNDRCMQRAALPYTLHQVALADEEVGVLQLDNLHVSFELDNKLYTCLRARVLLGRMTLLWRADDNQHCYEQEKDKAYVQQFAEACATEVDWQLVPEVGLKKFACAKDNIKISSDCFVAGNSCQAAGDWPETIKTLHGTAGSPNPPAIITADTLLKDVEIKAEWELVEGVNCAFDNSFSLSLEPTFVISGGSSRLISPGDLHSNTNISIGQLESFDTFNCISTTNVTFGDDYFIPSGVCINKNIAGVDSLEDCSNEAEYIKITFKAKK